MRLAVLIAAIETALPAMGSDTIPLAPRRHMDQATLDVYNRIRKSDGLLLGLGELFAPPVPRQRFEPLYGPSIDRWKALYPEAFPACYEFEVGERNRTVAIREWAEAARFADLGGIVWLQLSLNNFSVPYGGRQGRAVAGGMSDTSNGLDAVLPDGAAHEKFDAYMRQLASEVKEFGRPCVLRPFHEMNGGWFW
jgi:Glycosyl hydrolase family 26